MGTGSFPGVKIGRSVTLTPHPLLVPLSRKSRAKPLLFLWAVRPVQSLSVCTRVHLAFFTMCFVWLSEKNSNMPYTSLPDWVLWPKMSVYCAVRIESLCNTVVSLMDELRMSFLGMVGRLAQPIYRLTTGWTIRDRIPVGTRFSARPDRLWGLPSLLYNGCRVFPGGKVRPGRAADHSPPSSAAVMEE